MLGSGTNIGGQVLGSTAVAGGIAALPKTTGSFPLSFMVTLTILTGTAAIISFVVSKLYKKLAK